MGTVKEYGFNHVRFHSWCPPEAAFTAADELGLYLQVELPMWIKDVGKYPARQDFFEQEMYAILNEYGNHPSFLLFCNGNEIATCMLPQQQEHMSNRINIIPLT